VIEFGSFVRFGVVLIRPGALIMTAPLFGGTHVQPMAKVGLSVLLAIVVAPVVTLPAADVGLTVLVARELVIGFSIGLAVRIVMSAAELAGYLAGFQAGFAIAAIIDPQQGVRNNMIAVLYGGLAVFVFFAVNGHHEVLVALVESYEALPMGSGAVDQSLVGSVAGALGLIFRVALQMAAPVIFALLIVELGLGLIARVAPAMNLMVLGFPIRVLAGLVALGLAVGVVPPLLRILIPRSLELAARTAGAFQ
jgi:flagellar biosynthetic protein FliR